MNKKTPLSIIMMIMFVFSTCPFAAYGMNNSSINEMTTDEFNLSSVGKMRSSMDIIIPNVDLNTIHDPNPLGQEQKALLVEHGFTFDQIALMDEGDFNDAEKTWQIPDESITDIKIIYTELNHANLAEWTWGDFWQYAQEVDKIKYTPTLKQRAGLLKKGITLDDARFLLKEYTDYDTVLKADSAEIKALLSKYYQFKIDMLNEMDAVQQTRFISNNMLLTSDPPVNLQGTTYRWVTFPNYGSDWFHVDSRSHISSSERTYQAARIQEAYNYIFGVSQTYACGNLYGTWAASSNGAHEGIDMNYGSSSVPLKWFGYGNASVYDRVDSNGSLVINNSSIGKYFLYRHMNNTYYSIGNNISRGSTVGTQGTKGGVTGAHLHLEVMGTATTSANFPYAGDSGKENTLDSGNIYAAIAMAFTPM
jgi:hypothetical protein